MEGRLCVYVCFLLFYWEVGVVDDISKQWSQKKTLKEVLSRVISHPLNGENHLYFANIDYWVEITVF